MHVTELLLAGSRLFHWPEKPSFLECAANFLGSNPCKCVDFNSGH
jgi:hypothetical protein